MTLDDSVSLDRDSARHRWGFEIYFGQGVRTWFFDAATKEAMCTGPSELPG